MTQTPAGWYPDADGVMRWWDGSQWTQHTQGPAQPQAQSGQPQSQPGQPQSQPQQPAYGAAQQPPGQQPAYGMMPGGPGGPQKRRMSPGLLAGIGGGVVAILVIVGLVIFLTSRNDDDSDTASDSTSTSASSDPSATPSDEPSEEPSDEPSDEPTDSGGDLHQQAADAPKDASVSDFCDSFDLQGLQNLGSGGSLSDLQKIQQDMLAVGTPSDMPADARRGWEWFASVSSENDVSGMNQDDLHALGTYYGKNCM